MIRPLTRRQAVIRRRPMLLVVPAAVAAAAALAACGQSGASPGASSSSSSTTTAPPASGAAAAVGLKTAKAGSVTVLTNAQGLTLYSFAPDQSAKSVCNGACATRWPPVKPAAG